MWVPLLAAACDKEQGIKNALKKKCHIAVSIGTKATVHFLNDVFSVL